MLIAVAVAGGIVIRDGAFLDGVGVLETRDGAYYSRIWCLSDERWYFLEVLKQRGAETGRSDNRKRKRKWNISLLPFSLPINKPDNK